MKERPIIFSGPMVRAILEGRKTQTRRVVKPQRKNMVYDLSGAWVDPGGTIWGPGPYLKVPVRHVDDTFDDGIIDRVFCPYGPVGTRLWVRETWAVPVEYDDTAPRDIPQDVPVQYAVESMALNGREGAIRSDCRGRWRPSIHMPRWASRILLEVEDVRLERVQDISDLDALAEGIQVIGRTEVNDLSRGKFRHAFRALWDSINAKRGHGWDKNPWVWVVQFRVVNAQEA